MRRLHLLSAAALALGCGAAAAEGADVLNQKVWLRVGAFRPNIDSNIQIDDSSTGLGGTAVNLEDVLGLAKKKTLPTLLLGTRFGDGWRAEFEYFRLKRDSTQTLAETITIDDTTYPVAASIATKFDSAIWRASLGYSFVKTPQVEVGAVVGIHVTRFDFAVEGQVVVAGGAVAAQREEQNRTVPLPTLGLYGTWAIAPGWAASGRVDLFKLRHGEYDGRLVNTQANVIYRFNPNFGLGVGYRYDDYKVTSTRSDFRGYVNYKFKGPQVFLEAGF